MDPASLETAIKSLLYCAVSCPDEEHLCDNPINLSCGHFICTSCYNKFRIVRIVCKKCNTPNSRSLEEKPNLVLFHFVLEKHMKDVFEITQKQFKCKLERLKEMKNDKESINLCVQFIKDDIEIRFESVKNELDKLYKTFMSELEKMKKKLNDEDKEIHYDEFDDKIFENELKKLDYNIKNEENLTKESLYYYQNQMKKLMWSVKDLNDNKSRIKFEVSVTSLKDAIGKITLDESVNRRILRRIKEGSFEKFQLPEKPIYVYAIQNSKLLIVCFAHIMHVYDENMNLVNKIHQISNVSVQCCCLVCGETEDELYLCNKTNNSVVKTDLEFHELAKVCSFEECNPKTLNEPSGICYYKKHIYICDYNNERIIILDSDLGNEKAFKLDYKPSNIHNIENIAMVKALYEGIIYFYNLDNLYILKVCKGTGSVTCGIVNNWFCSLEAYIKHMFIIYDQAGKVIEQIQSKGYELNYESTYFSSIQLFNSRLIMSNVHNQFLAFI